MTHVPKMIKKNCACSYKAMDTKQHITKLSL